MTEVQKFLHWWRDDVERAKCNLEQATGAYVSSFPGRMYVLLIELLGPVSRFMDKIERKHGCWIWTASQLRWGYGSFRVAGKTISAHRFSYSAFKGEIPEGKIVMHTCDNTSCVNPAHLKLGTHAENIADRDQKGRTATGERNGSSKLTAAQVSEIRSSSATQVELAERYGVHQSTISKIQLGKKWKNA